MLHKQYQQSQDVLKNQIWEMKGQAVPLFSYHMLRDYVLPAITGEHQGAVLYWLGKDLARMLTPSTTDELVELFLETGWGQLEVENDQKHIKTFILQSPFFKARNIEKNEASFALECGFLTECLAMIEQSETQGEFHLKGEKKQHLHVHFTIHIQQAHADK